MRKHIILFFKKIEEVLVGPVSMWITPIFNRNTAYPHVDRLCASLR